VSPPDHVDVLVVGAGPAGAAAACEAHRLGLDVLVVDKARFPRDKTCGDGLTTGALRHFEALGVDVRALPSYAPVRETVIVSPSGREVVLPLPDDGEYAAAVMRHELDSALVDETRRRGVHIREGLGVRGIEAGDDDVAVAFDDGTASRARWVIAADGHYSPVRRMLAANRDASGTASAADLGTWHAFRQYFHGVRDDRMWVLFDAELLPGYAWVFPLGGGRANVGFGVLRSPGNDRAPSGKRIAGQWRDVVSHPKLRAIIGAEATPDGPARAWPIPAAFDPARLADDHVLFAGDAAHVVDPMTGEGIAQAIDSGLLAARAISDGGTAHSVTARYRNAVDRALGADLRFARQLQQLLRTPLGARAAIRAAGLTPWTRRNFARWMFEDYPRAIVLTPRRWRREVFRRHGAYRTPALPTLDRWPSPSTG
jgi:geranylgeranyl reductase family protein